MEVHILIPVVMLSLGVGFFVGWYISGKTGENRIASAKDVARKIVIDAEKEAQTLKREKLIEVKDEWYSKKKEFDRDVQNKRNKLQGQERALDGREENIDRRVELLSKKERDQATLQRGLEEKARVTQSRHDELEKLVAEQNIRLERTSGLSPEEAKRLLIENTPRSLTTSR